LLFAVVSNLLSDPLDLLYQIVVLVLPAGGYRLSELLDVLSDLLEVEFTDRNLVLVKVLKSLVKSFPVFLVLN